MLYGIQLSHDAISVDPWLPCAPHARVEHEPPGDVGLGEEEGDQGGEEKPWSFEWKMGQIEIQYYQGWRAVVRVPRVGRFSFAIGGMDPPGSLFSVAVECKDEASTNKMDGALPDRIRDLKPTLRLQRLSNPPSLPPPPSPRLVASSDNGIVRFHVDLSRCRPPASIHDDPLGADGAGEFQRVVLQRVDRKGETQDASPIFPSEEAGLPVAVG